MPRNLSIQKMLKQARCLKSNFLEISDEFCKKYQEKIIEYSKEYKKGNDFQKHLIEIKIPTEIGENLISFNFYSFGLNCYVITNIVEFQYAGDKVLVNTLMNTSELDLIIKLLKLWEQD